MSYVQIPNELFKANLTSLQFRFLANFIRISGLNNGHSFFGYPNLANINQCGKVAAIKTVQELEKMGFIQVVERGNRSRSNDILLTLDKGLSRLNSGENDEVEGYLKDTPKANEGYLKDTRGYLKDTPGYLNDTPHKDLKDLNNINLNNIYGEGYLKDTPKTEEGAEENIAPDDMTSGRTMPSQQAGERLAKRVSADPLAAKDEVLSVWRDCEAHFKDISADLELFQVGKSFGIRKKSKFALTDDIRAQEVQSWLSERGIIATVIDSGKHYLGEIVIGR